MKKSFLTILFAFAASMFCLAQTAIAEATTPSLEQQGDSCLEANNVLYALRNYEAAYKNEPNVMLKQKIAWCHYLRGAYTAAIDSMQRIMDEDVAHRSMRMMYYCYQRLNNYDSMVYWGKTALEEQPLDAEIVAGVAMGYSKINQAYKAIALCQKYCETDSTNVNVLRQYSDASFFEKDFNTSATLLERLLSLGDTTVNNTYTLGMCYEQLHRYDEAKAALDKAIELTDSLVPGPLYHVGAVYQEMGEYELAADAFLKAKLALVPDKSLMYIVCRGEADALFAQGRYPEAVACYNEATRYKGNSMTTMFYTARCYEEMRATAEAMSRFNIFIMIAEREPDPTDGLQELLTEAKTRYAALKEMFEAERKK